MARHNLVFLYGFVTAVQIQRHPSGNSYAVAYVTVARSERSVGDHKYHMKCDSILIMCRDEAILKEMSTWKQYDFVEVKGPISAKTIGKGSFCVSCGEKNVADGVMVFVNPIFAKKRAHFDTQEECMAYLTENREVSNMAFIFGTLCRDPKKVTPKEGLIVTQYQIALNRKFRIRTDDPQIKSDYPWVKSYGDNAISDREHLHIGSDVFIDGCLQARKVNRHTTCAACGKSYDWADFAMEVVPYETEYVANFYTEEEVEQRKAAIAEQKVAGILSRLVSFKDNILPDDKITDQDFKDGMIDDEF